MLDAKLKIHDELDKQSKKLEYLAEKEDRSGLSEILLDISRRITYLKYDSFLEIKEDEDVKAD